MIHLFKKVYLESDQKINVDVDRIIISKEFGYAFSSDFDPICSGVQYFSVKNFELFLKSLGATEEQHLPPPRPDEPEQEDLQEELRNLLLSNQDGSKEEIKEEEIEIKQSIVLFDDFYQFINFIDECYEMKKRPLIIYVDQDGFDYFMSHWWKILFVNLNFDSFINLMSRYLEYSKIFSTSELYWNQNSEIDLEVKNESLKLIFDSITIEEEKTNAFMERYKKHLSVEFLISSYLYDEKCIEELLPIFSLLVRRNIENILGSYRQRIFSYITKKQFLKNIGITDFEKYKNFYDIISDKETILYTYFNESIWNSKYVTHSTTKSPLKFENITEKDLENIIILAQKIDMDNWEFQDVVNYYNNVDYRSFKNIKGNGTICNKIDIILFLEYFKNKDQLTPEELKKVLYYDINKNLYEEINFVYTFCSSDYSTVNNYFVDYIFDLKRENNDEELKKYVLR